MEFRIFEHGLVDSTSERALAALANGLARHGDVHVATGQTAGRGRRGAAWFSAPGEGLYASVVLLPGQVLDPAALTMGAGLALRAGLSEAGLARAELKWPNDLLVGGAKLCGILAETRGLDPRAPHCVLGIGVNVAQRTFPEELLRERAVTSLAACGIEIAPRALLDLLLPHLARELERLEREPEETARDWFAATGLAKRRVRVSTADGRFEGRWIGCDLAQGVALALPDGGVLRFRLEHVRALAEVD